jgi:signal peptidase I
MPSRRRPWWAALLALCCPGLGHLYAGRPGGALLLFFAQPAVQLALLALAMFLPVGRSSVLIGLLLYLLVRVLVAVDAARCARAFAADRVPVLSRWYSCVAFFVVASMLAPAWAHAFRASVAHAFRLPAAGMEPTLLSGDHIISASWAYHLHDPILGRPLFVTGEPARGDLAVFLFPEDHDRSFIKRVIGLPGEVVEVHGRVVSIDGKPLAEPYTQFLEESPGPMDTGPAKVPPDSYFVLGDNRDNSRDSRFWGYVKRDELWGRVVRIYWSRDPEDGHVRWSRIGAVPK